MQEIRVKTSLTPWSRRLAGAALAASALWLAGCGSSVKLDENRQPAPIVDSSASSQTGSTAASTVAPVVTTDSQNGALDPNLARVIYFDYDSFIVKDEFRPTVEGYARFLNGDKTRRITVEGHTDERGGREYNLALGQKRAEATVKALSLLGVSPEQVEAVSFGEERPAAEGASEEAWSQNRRAEFKNR